jgi:hypothetical protein
MTIADYSEESRHLGPARAEGGMMTVASIFARVTVMLALAVVVAACSSSRPRPVELAPVMSEYKGWNIGVTPSVVYGSANLWRARIRVWPPEVRPETHPGINVQFSGTATNRQALEQAATAAAREYIDASMSSANR